MLRIDTRIGVNYDAPRAGVTNESATWMSGFVASADHVATASVEPTLCSAINIAAHLPRMAAEAPHQRAVIVTQARDKRSGKPVYQSWTFAELEALSNRYANGLTGAGFTRGERVILMVRPGVDFVALVFALFKIGAVPVMIDPGMGLGRLLECIRNVDAGGLIGVPAAHAVRVLRRSAFRKIKHVVTVGRRWFWGGPTLDELARNAGETYTVAATAPGETAAILFTSGATGSAKGVVYEHAQFEAQVRSIRDHYGIEPGEVDLPAFPLFALFSVAMGMTSVIPEMDPSRPARVDPAKIVNAIRDHRVTNTFGSPAIWSRVGRYCQEHGITLPSLRRILIAGAPVQPEIIKRIRSVLGPEADVHTPYGATECLPISSISGREILSGPSDRTRRGAGICVGRALPGADVRFIGISDDAIAEWSDDLEVGDGELGEIVVAGEVVTKAYFGRPDADRLAKIREVVPNGCANGAGAPKAKAPPGEEPSVRIWHRIGDIGYRDADGRIWMCGRKGHRVETAGGTLFSVRCEAIFNQHDDVARSALVGIGAIGAQRPIVVVEPIVGRFPSRKRAARFTAELLALGRANDLTRDIRGILFHRSLPVDVRHNAKINREALAVWAAKRLR